MTIQVTEQEIETGAVPAQPAGDNPFPQDPRLIMQAGLLFLAVMTALYFAREIILPILLAFILKLLLQPGMRVLERLRVPRLLAALLLIAALFGLVAMIGMMLSAPAAEWIAKLPESMPRLHDRLSFVMEPLDSLRRFLHQAERFAQTGSVPAPPAPKPPAPDLSDTVFTGTRAFAAGLFTMMLLLFFLLLSGDTFLRKLVEILPRFRDKRQAVDISQQIERDISAYLVTITIMNAAVGIATGLLMWGLGLGNPLLWGTIAFLLNYVPILGPTAGIVLFAAIGLMSFDTLWAALLPAILYLVIHLVEGETVTPMLLARRFTLNPVLVMMSLIFWDWMWGVPGAILAVPMLAIAKIICDRIRPLAPFGHFLGG